METKIPFYNLVNMLLTGLIFTGCCIALFHNLVLNFIGSDFFKSVKEINVGLETIMTISFCAVIYEIGFIINRIGSLFETLLKKIKIIPYDDDYIKFNEKKKQFPIMEILSREYTLSRTSMTLFLLMTIISFFNFYFYFTAIMFVLTILYYFSMRKYANRIVNLMKEK